MKQKSLTLVVLLFSTAIVGCSNSLSDEMRSQGDASYTNSSGGDSSTGLSAGGPGGGSPGGGPPGGAPIQSGQVTAGEWDDSSNFNLFTAFFKSESDKNPSLAPFKLLQPGSVANFASQHLQISLVMDTTGSMGDEMSYLKSEMADIFSGLPPAVTIDKSLIVYRDQGDTYVTRVFPFSNLATFLGQLNAQSAGGGGDFPEAMQSALKDMLQLSWSSDPSVKKIVFLLADAPPHDQDIQETADLVRAALAKGLKIYPIAASGADKLTEAIMRSTAAQTGGRYIFITNDSGIGGDHLEPSIPCYKVEYLNKLIHRTIQSEIDGAYIPPNPADILRTEGACN